ncbi:MAG: DUF3108 domain-containing protein, partial [Candidatus Omnitrophota bacterium]
MPGCAGTGIVKTVGSVKGVSEEKVLEHMSRKVDLLAGREFVFLIAWNNIPVGRIVARAGDIINYRGRDVYVVQVVTESNDFLSRIYRVEDTYTSYVDARDMTSRRYEADRREGNYRKHVVVEYDFDKMEAVYTNRTDGSVKTCPIEKDVQDPLSAICYFMTLPVKPGDMVKITINLNEKNYGLFGRVEGIRVVKLARFGEMPAFRIKPYAELNGEPVDKGKGWLYFSADEKRHPLYGVVLIPFGRVTATLREIKDTQGEAER